MSGDTVALLVVPNGSHRPEPLAAAVRTHHPDWDVAAVWAGDPHLRPVLQEVPWTDADVPELALVRGDVKTGEWQAALAATKQLLVDHHRVVVLWVGACAVLGPLDGLQSEAALTFVARSPALLPRDGLEPSEADLVEAGRFSSNIAVFQRGAAATIDWLVDQLNRAPQLARTLERSAELFHVGICDEPSIGAGRWRWDIDHPQLLDLDGFEADQPWTLAPHSERPQRVELLGHPNRRAVIRAAAQQLGGQREMLCLPGGLVVDDVVRRVVAEANTDVPQPWSQPGSFRDWLAERYWRTVHADRPDLWAAFPDPEHRSAEHFGTWCRQAFVFDQGSLVLPVPAAHEYAPVVNDDLRSDGVNLVGYFTRQSGLADVARRLARAAELAGVPHTRIASQRTASPVLPDAGVDQRADYDTTLCVVNADQFVFLADDFRNLFSATRRMIGYWFWELEDVPLHMRRSAALVDEIWAGTKFVADAFAAATHKQVRHVPIPVAKPEHSSKSRAELSPMLRDIGDRPLLLCTFDHFSVTERKNPVGVIEAFCRAFEPDEGPILLIKTMNGRKRWPHHLRVLAAADGRRDIRVWDETLDRADQMALVAAADCMVSLHRSEGLGLHLAEAMWLGTPVIATRYSGNLDFMDDDNSLLIDAQLVNVERGEGVYPPTALWADPDLDLAATAMRRIVGDDALRMRLATAGRRTMESQPTLADTGRLISRLLLGEG